MRKHRFLKLSLSAFMVFGLLFLNLPLSFASELVTIKFDAGEAALFDESGSSIMEKQFPLNSAIEWPAYTLKERNAVDS